MLSEINNTSLYMPGKVMGFYQATCFKFIFKITSESIENDPQLYLK